MKKEIINATVNEIANTDIIKFKNKKNIKAKKGSGATTVCTK